jgi:hypothetical protein
MKFLGVRRDQRQIENERVAGNQQIVRTDWRSCRLQLKTQHAGAASDIRAERNFFNNIQQGLHLLRFATGIPRPGSSGIQFKTRNDRDPTIVGRQCAQFVDHGRDVAQQINASVGVQQVFHANLTQSWGTGGRLPWSGRRNVRSVIRIFLKKLRGHRRFDFGSMITALPSFRMNTSVPSNR